jgi:hypothetical protein
MTLQELVVKRETAQRLKEAGFPQNNCFNYKVYDFGENEKDWRLYQSDRSGILGSDEFSAPTLEEILLEIKILQQKTIYDWDISLSFHNDIFMFYFDGIHPVDCALCGTISAVESAARMWLYLKGKGVL